MYKRKGDVEETSVKASKLSFADALKNNIVIPDKNKQNKYINTKEDLNKKVDTINFKIVNIKQRKNGSVVMQGENNEEREKIKKC